MVVVVFVVLPMCSSRATTGRWVRVGDVVNLLFGVLAEYCVWSVSTHVCVVGLVFWGVASLSHGVVGRFFLN
jgi:hypothetical protein